MYLYTLVYVTFSRMKQRAKSKTKLCWCAGDSIRQYLAGPPGPPGPQGAPSASGSAGDVPVDDLANRVIAYIQSMTNDFQNVTSVTTQDALTWESTVYLIVVKTTFHLSPIQVQVEDMMGLIAHLVLQDLQVHLAFQVHLAPSPSMTSSIYCNVSFI